MRPIRYRGILQGTPGGFTAINIKNPETYRLARELAAATGETLTQAITQALRDRLAALRRHNQTALMVREVAQIQQAVRELPDLDARSPDEILGYDDSGLPG